MHWKASGKKVNVYNEQRLFPAILSRRQRWEVCELRDARCETRLSLRELNDDGSDSRALTEFKSLPCHSPSGIRKTLTSSLIFYTFSHINFQKQRSLFDASQRRRVEPHVRLISIVKYFPANWKCLQIVRFQLLMAATGSDLPFGRIDEHW